MKRKNNFWLYFLLAIVLLIVIVVWLISFGQINLVSEKKEKTNVDDLIERRKKLTSRHNKLKALIETKTQLKVRLERKFRNFYFVMRLTLLLVWLCYNVLIVKMKWAIGLSAILNWNEAALLSLFSLNFLIYGNVVGVKESISSAKNYLENRVYRKYINIETQIAGHTAASEQLAAELAKIEDEIQLKNPVEKLIEKV